MRISITKQERLSRIACPGIGDRASSAICVEAASIVVLLRIGSEVVPGGSHWLAAAAIGRLLLIFAPWLCVRSGST